MHIYVYIFQHIKLKREKAFSLLEDFWKKKKMAIISSVSEYEICDQWFYVRVEARHKQYPSGVGLGTGALQHLHQ